MNYIKNKVFCLFVLFSFVCQGQIEYEEIPINKQLFGRDFLTNLGNFTIKGKIIRNGDVHDYESIIVKTYKEEVLDSTKTTLLNYVNDIALFDFSLNIKAELTNYKVEILVKKESEAAVIVKEIFELVAGDVYVVQGQSNAVSQGPKGTTEHLKSNFIRSFGHTEISNPNNLSSIQDKTWYYANGDKRDSTGFVGEWGLKLANLIVKNYQIPVAIFNGARGGRTVDYFLAPNDYKNNPESSNYGHLYYRLNTAGLKNKVRAVFWSQGENNSVSRLSSTTKYKNNFNTLKNSWFSDYMNIGKIYIFQTKHGCKRETEHSMNVREAQRLLGEENKETISIMSTAALMQRVDKCHFLFTNGYESFADRIFPLVQRDFYGRQSEIDINAPMIVNATYLDNTITVYTNAEQLEMNLDIQDILNHYKLTGAGSTEINNMSVQNNSIKFILSEKLSSDAFITYAPDT